MDYNSSTRPGRTNTGCEISVGAIRKDMLNWVGIDQPMKMRETSRAIDKKLWGNNIWTFLFMMQWLDWHNPSH